MSVQDYSTHSQSQASIEDDPVTCAQHQLFLSNATLELLTYNNTSIFTGASPDFSSGLLLD